MKRHILTLACLGFGLLFGLTGCTALYGIKENTRVDEKTIVRYANQYNIPIADGYELDTSYFAFLLSHDKTLYREQINNHYQPLQALYFDKSGQLQSFQINCYAGGFPNLQWNRNGIMTTFPPGKQAPVDSLTPLDVQLKYLKPLSQTVKIAPDQYDYIVVVYWNRFIGRQSKRLIRFVQKNSKLETRKKIKIIYVNNDNLFARK
jgi:hypothetical protein